MKQYIVLFVTLLILTFPFKAIALLESDSASDTASLELVQKAEINVDDYQLPYPGLLPDNPLYPLKALRDRFVSLLISDPLKKAEFNLLQADKRLQAGKFLVEQKSKYPLAIETISKGENYFEEAISKIIEARKQGKSINDITDRMKKSSIIHQATISRLTNRVPKDYKEVFKKLDSRSAEIRNKVSKINL